MISRRTFLAVAGGALLLPHDLLSADSAPKVPPMLDHILLGCSDLDQGIAFVEQHTGVRPAIGGVHPGRGTRNALLSLGEMHYLEVIAPDPAQAGTKISRESMVNTLKAVNAPRIIDWAVRTNDISGIADQLRKNGVAFNGPTPGSRQRPDGKMLHWQTLNLDDDQDGLLPFFIRWGVDSIHPSVDAPSGCKLQSFTAAAPDVPALVARFRQLGIEVGVESGAKPELRAQIAGPRGNLDLSS
jgi:hypothetical protein